MKRLFKVLTLTFVIGFCGVLTSSTPIDVEKAIPSDEEYCATEELEEDGLFCRVKTSNGTNWCLFCNCKNMHPPA